MKTGAAALEKVFRPFAGFEQQVESHPLPRLCQTRITASFLFVLVRVISWIACYAPRKVIHK